MLLRAGVQGGTQGWEEGRAHVEGLPEGLGPHLVGEQLFWAGCLQNDSGEGWDG